MKTCCVCKLSKQFYEFNKCSGRKDGLQTKCRTCDNKHTMSYQKYNWKAQKSYQAEHRRQYRTVNVNFRLAQNLRSRLYIALKGEIKLGSSVSDLGCSIEFFKQYLESKFLSGMSWENYGLKGWHIDHIKPLSTFHLSDPEQLTQARHYTNLQP